MKFQDGSVINGEGDRQEGRFVVCRSGGCGDISRELPAEMPESFMVDAVEAGIRGLAHSTGEPVVVVLVPLRGVIFSPSFLASAAGKEETE